MDKKKLKILVIGSGGREHALIWKIIKSKKAGMVFCAPGNAGTSALCKNINIKSTHIRKLVKFALTEKIDLTVVGPEAPLIEGIVDAFEGNNLKIFGPRKSAAQIEGSKIFAKQLMNKYHIPTAKYNVFDERKKASEYLKNQKFPQVIKADGPYLGKGVCVAKNQQEAQSFLTNLNTEKVIIEEYLEGQEVSFMALSDGVTFKSLLPSQDHKRIFDGDKGPNTGGMGSYAPLNFIDKNIIQQIEREIVKPTLDALKKEGCPYKGVLYPGLMMTINGPKVLEFNCRFGDPETQSVISLLKTDIVDLLNSVVEGKINDIELEWEEKIAVCVVLASKGYPGEYKKGIEVKGLQKLANKKSVRAYHSGTAISDSKIVTCGGRVIGIQAKAKNLRTALKSAYKYIGLNGVHFEGMQYRKDIGHFGLENLYAKKN